MSTCKHENRTIDCVCNDCGYDLIVEPQAERYRQEERERIVKLIELIQSTAMEEDGILEAVISAVKGEQVTTFGYEWINDFIKGEEK